MGIYNIGKLEQIGKRIDNANSMLVKFEHGTWGYKFNTCLEYSEKLKAQDYHQRVAGDKIYLKVYCIPKKVEQK